MKSGFLTNLCVRLKEWSDGVWFITAPLKYYSEKLNLMIVVPPWYEVQGETASQQAEIWNNREPYWFETDFASVPRLPVLYSMWGDRAHREAALHDYLYREDSEPMVTKAQADSLFLEAMESTGKPWYIRYPMYMGVVMGGGSSYHKRKVRDKL